MKKSVEDYMNESNDRKAMTKDPVVLNVMEMLNSRSKVGFKEYGMSLRDDNTRTMEGWITEVQHELLDACNYLEKLKEMNPNHMEIGVEHVTIAELERLSKSTGVTTHNYKYGYYEKVDGDWCFYIWGNRPLIITK